LEDKSKAYITLFTVLVGRQLHCLFYRLEGFDPDNINLSLTKALRLLNLVPVKNFNKKVGSDSRRLRKDVS
jgi:hypothetical protein